MQNTKILIADDEPRMRRLVADFLKNEGFRVFEAEDGNRVLEIFEKNPKLDIVILDVMMPGYDGWDVCRCIRKTSAVPVIMLTARSEETDEIFGLELGADEYITKPFSPGILVARVKALLRRVRENDGNIKSFNDLVIDLDRHEVTLDGKKLDLSPKEFELLDYLTENENIALTREQVLNAVWDFDYFGDPRTVDTHIKKLRLKLGEKSSFIQTVRGVGYRFEVVK